MGHKPYSKFDSIPTGHASERLTEGCLVLEGGAFRGLYTQGIVDTLMLLDINFSCVVGVSAGALAGMGYVSGQVGRAARINIGYRHDSRYIGWRAFLNSRSMLDVGFLLEDRGILEPFDWERFNRSEQRFLAVATNCRTGAATFFEKGSCSDINQAVRASASMPYTTPMVMVDGEPYLDGACSNRIPYDWALEQGYDKIVVIRTRDLSYRKADKDVKLAEVMYRGYLELVDNLATAGERYNFQCDEIERLHGEGRIFRIAPS
ncbi:MAG: patatin family protein, partial [Atopobiaceae bacterium]|nr:patatin family protein [Atopobiaceae bacterium]